MLPLREIIGRHVQYDKNANAAESRLVLEDSTLASVGNVFTRISELAVQANNGSLNGTDRMAIAQEIRQRLGELIGLANTRDSNGEYLFAGDNVSTAPFSENPPGTFNYNGDSGQRNVQIGASRQIAVGDPGDDVFVNIPFSGGGNQNIFQTINDFAVSLEANTPSTIVLTDMQSAADNVLTVRAQIGARLNAIDSHRELNQGVVLQSQESLSDIEDLDYTEAVSRLNLQLVALQASQQTFAKIQNLSLFNYI
jgi:flagellar hook-associated protein 3 FlgL